jgi:co-chaperonin GroES (HSP10)
MTSGIHPVGHRVLVLPEVVEHKSAGGIILGTASQSQREQMAQVNALVVELGTTAYSDQPVPWCTVGQRVVIGKYAGLVKVGLDEQLYRIINDLDVVATIDEGVK